MIASQIIPFGKFHSRPLVLLPAVMSSTDLCKTLSIKIGDLKIMGLWGQLEAGILQNLQQ